LPEEFVQLMREKGSSLQLPEVSISDSEGEQLPVRLSGTVLKEGDQVLGAAAFLQDLRDYKRLAQEKLDSERLAAVGSTVAQLAHGIKNILTGLEGGMYVIRSGIKKGSTERTNKGWDMLERNVQRITALVRGFLSFSKGHTPAFEPTDPNQIARDVVDLYSDAAREKGVRLGLETCDDITEAELDPEDIRTCLENLLSNAMDACEASRKEDQTVTVRVARNNGELLYEVDDNGVGMDCEIKNKVFTTFFTTKGMGGTGLGLLVTRKIVQEHGGRVEIESVPNEGSVFRIELPLEKPNVTANGARQAGPDHAEGESKDGQTGG
jgi:signal transduction histidine kinase